MWWTIIGLGLDIAGVFVLAVTDSQARRNTAYGYEPNFADSRLAYWTQNYVGRTLSPNLEEAVRLWGGWAAIIVGFALQIVGAWTAQASAAPTTSASAGALNPMAVISQPVLAASAAVGAYVAWRGLHTWKAQLKGQNSYELARRLLRAVYEVRDEIYTVRGPMMLAGEIAEALKEAGFEDEEIDRPLPNPDTSRAVYQMRWKGLAEALSDLQVEEREAEVLWEKDRRELTVDLHRCVSELRYAVWQHLRHQGDSIHANLDPEKLRELEDVLYMTSRDPDEDEFTGQVEEAVQKIETDVRPYLKIP